MDLEYQRRLIQSGFDELPDRLSGLGWHGEADLLDRITFLSLHGPAGNSESYLVKIAPYRYPVGPWSVGFIDPTLLDEERLQAPEKDPRFWPLSPVPGLHGGFHISYPGPYRVFVCLPFTLEYFHYHPDHPWLPDVHDLPGIAARLHDAVQKATHFSRWRPVLFEEAGL